MRLIALYLFIPLLACSELRGSGLLSRSDGGADTSETPIDAPGSGGAGELPTAGNSGAGGGEGSTTSPPQVVSVEPADGSLGVNSNVQIVLQFNKRMNRLSVQRAWDSTDLRAADLNWSWQETPQGDRLTATPKSPLEYADNVARTYTFAISAQAADSQNQTMVPFASSFSMLKRITSDVTWNATLSGSVGFIAATNTNVLQPGELRLGLYSVNRGFLTFDLSALFKDARGIQSAELRVYQREDTYCDPFATSSGCYQGTVDVASLRYAALSEDLRATPTPRDRLGTISNNWKSEWKALNVTPAIDDIYKMSAEEADVRAQFLLFFSMGKPEEVWLDFSKGQGDPGGPPVLRVQYLSR